MLAPRRKPDCLHLSQFVLNNAPMIISRAPLRVSFLGGGSDIADFYQENGGIVLSTTVDKFIYVTVKKLLGFFDHTIRLTYSKTELVNSVDKIQHPGVREALKMCGIDSHIEVNIIADLPAKTGLGSSGAFYVALLKALHAFKGEYVSPVQLAHEAIHLERVVLNESGGAQDQYAASLGGFNKIFFGPGKKIRHEPILMSQNRIREFESNLLIFYTQIQRSAAEISEDQVKKSSNTNKSFLNDLKAMALRGAEILETNAPLIEFGKLLDDGWKIKKSLSNEISNSTIDDMYNLGKEAGAVGGKLLGAGGGGFLLFYVEKDRQESLKRALNKFKAIPFYFESSGCQIVYHTSSDSARAPAHFSGRIDENT